MLRTPRASTYLPNVKHDICFRPHPHACPGGAFPVLVSARLQTEGHVFARSFSLVQSDGCVRRGLARIRPRFLSASSFCPYPRRPWWQWDVFAHMRTDQRVFPRGYFPLSIRWLRMFNRKGFFARRLGPTTVSARTPITPRSKTQPSPCYSGERAPFSGIFSDVQLEITGRHGPHRLVYRQCTWRVLPVAGGRRRSGLLTACVPPVYLQ
jgi:hypothetical protein